MGKKNQDRLALQPADDYAKAIIEIVANHIRDDWGNEDLDGEKAGDHAQGLEALLVPSSSSAIAPAVGPVLAMAAATVAVVGMVRHRSPAHGLGWFVMVLSPVPFRHDAEQHMVVSQIVVGV